jgi:hypothetical protein
MRKTNREKFFKNRRSGYGEIRIKAKEYHALYIFSGEKKRAEERLDEEVRQRSDLAQEVTRLNTTINHKDIEVRLHWIEVS